ncbi:myb-like protein D [Cotesia glomerata]|uniref:myb-like protein D n=1 Tax=Cotesia glomerata TaxID=32391 RepID=UPI001D02AAEC|nr:myb-like protein D [Cotesia glomerata]
MLKFQYQSRFFLQLATKKKILSEHEKFKKANEVAKKLPALAAEVGSKSYVNRLKILTDIQEAWQNNEEVEIIRLNSQNQKVTNKTSRKIRNTNNNISVENDDDNDDNNEAVGDANNIHDNGDNEDENNDSDSNDDLDNDFNELIKFAETSESNLAEDTFRFENNEDSNTEDLQGFQSTVGINSDRSTFDVNNNEQITACTKELQQSNQNNCRQANIGSSQN